MRLDFAGKGRSQVRTSLVDDELAAAIGELLAVPSSRARLFRYERDGGRWDLTSRTLNEYVKAHLGEEFSAKDFRTCERLGSTPAICRQSYVAPAVVDAYLEGRTLSDFRPRHLRMVGARQTALEPEEAALLKLLNSS